MSKREKRVKEKKPTRTYQFRLYPTHKQGRTLQEWLLLCCEVFNTALDERKSAYRMAGVSLSYEEQCAELPGCKAVRPDVAEVPSQVLQDVVKRVDLAFQAFFQRVDEGKKPGFPRFKSSFRYHSLTFKQFGNSFKLHTQGKKNRGMLELAKLGQVKMVMHRSIKGTPKTAIIKRTPTGKWFVNITVELDAVETQENQVWPREEEVGIDVGLKTFAYLSTAEEIVNPRFFHEDEAKLARAQHQLSKAAKGSKEREKKRKVVARAHERIANRRKNPAYTSQTCSACGHCQPMPLSVRVYECPLCGLVIHRDHNASLNILADARQACGRAGRVIPEAPGTGAVGSRHKLKG